MMAEQASSSTTWLIAAWPGMGNVAIIAAGYLVQELGMEADGELPSRQHFEFNEVTVKGGLVEPVRLPRGLFFRWKNPLRGPNLVVFLGEAQPNAGTYSYARELMDAAVKFGVNRVVAFASMASALHPAANPKVHGIATNQDLLEELRHAEVEPLGDGQIGGLNGVVLAAAAERGVPGFCLLAEIPYFAATVPNPKAARAALSVFSVLAGVDVSLDALNAHAAAVDRVLIAAYEKLKEQGHAEVDAEHASDEVQDDDEDVVDAPSAPVGVNEPPRDIPAASLDFATRQRIEQLFDDARKDQSKAVVLKQELDRLGAFKLYENRFLDLFRRAG